MALCDEGVCLFVPCDSSILSLPCFRKLAVKLTGTQSILQWTRQQTTVQNSVRFAVCRFTQWHLPCCAAVFSQLFTGAHSDCHYISHFDSALITPSLVVQIMQCNKTSWKWETNKHQNLVSVTLAVWKLNDNPPTGMRRFTTNHIYLYQWYTI